MRKILAIVFMVLLEISTHAPATASEAHRIVDKPYRYVFVGEVHGTAEAPIIFLGLVEDAVRQKHHVVVGLEIPAREQRAIDDFLHADDATASVAGEAMLSGEFWRPQNKMYDGRSSAAMLGLLNSLRKLVRNPGSDIQILCLGAPSDTGMAENIKKKLSTLPDHRLFALSGNLHAMRRNTLDVRIPTIPSFFPKDDTFTIDIRSRSGTAWICHAPSACGPITLTRDSRFSECRGTCTIPLHNDPQFDLAIVVEQSNASPPAVSGAPDQDERAPAASIRRCAVGQETLQEHLQLGCFGRRKAAEELLGHPGDDFHDLRVERAALGGQRHVYLAPVGAVAHAADDSLGFQAVHQARHRARIDAGKLAELIDSFGPSAHRADHDDELRGGQLQWRHLVFKCGKHRIAHGIDQVAEATTDEIVQFSA